MQCITGNKKLPIHVSPWESAGASARGMGWVEGAMRGHLEPPLCIPGPHPPKARQSQVYWGKQEGQPGTYPTILCRGPAFLPCARPPRWGISRPSPCGLAQPAQVVPPVLPIDHRPAPHPALACQGSGDGQGPSGPLWSQQCVSGKAQW